jgi:hypothetical protein
MLRDQPHDLCYLRPDRPFQSGSSEIVPEPGRHASSETSPKRCPTPKLASAKLGRTERSIVRCRSDLHGLWALSPGNQSLLPTTAIGTRESAESGDNPRHAQVSPHLERDGENANAVERQGQPWSSTGTITMRLLGRVPAGIAGAIGLIKPCGSCTDPLCKSRRDREVRWGARPAGPHEREPSALAHFAVPAYLT